MSDHIRQVGPHAHEWVLVLNDGDVFLQACGACGTRRIVGRDPRTDPPLANRWQRRWLDGGVLPGDVLQGSVG